MIKLKSVFVILNIILIISFFLFTCSESTGPDEENLVGTWKLTKMKFVYAFFTVEVDPTDPEVDLSMTLTIKSDNTYTLVTTDEGETTTVNGTWSTTGNKLMITENGEIIETEYSLDGNKLKISFEEEEEGETFTLIQEFTRQ